MIATILPSSPTFHAVAYNENKVTQGSARLLEIKNFGPINTFGYSDPNELSDYLMEYSSRNSRIKQPQFHLAISCKGHEYTEEQLVEFAHKYLKEMGYGDPEQPLLIYGHHDTDNTHIHIITSRVDPKGRKINDSHEKRRSQKTIEKILNTDMKAKAEKDIVIAKEFDFRNANQFKAVLEAMNYECYEKEGILYVKKGGVVQTKLPTSEIIKAADRNKLRYKNDPSENSKWRAIFKKYRNTNTSRTGLERDLKKMFGVSLVFFGKKDSPYGYVAIDFNKKKIYEGGNILYVKDLLDFKTPEEHMNEIEELINTTFEQNPHISTLELNKKLRRMGAFVRKDSLIFGNIKKAMADSHRAILERNNKIVWRNGFKPQNEIERDLLCKLTWYDNPEQISISTSKDGKYYCKDYKELSKIFAISDIKERKRSFDSAGYRLISDNSVIYAYRPETQTLTNLSKAGFDKESYTTLVSSQVGNKNSSSRTNVGNKTRQKSLFNGTESHDGSRYSNREWEVGKKETDRDEMDRNNGMTY